MQTNSSQQQAAPLSAPSGGVQPTIAGLASPRRLPIGAEVRAGGGVHFRLWAPAHRGVEVVLHRAAGSPSSPATAIESSQALDAEPNGYFSGFIAEAAAGDRYGFRLDGGEQLLADPASRFQPDGPHGLSEVVDPLAYSWNDDAWQGPQPDGQVLYEMHVGTFTRDGTWKAAVERLAWLADVGVTILQLMPVADFPGKRGWGYDGVNFFAPTRLYGRPDDFRDFVDEAHAVGLAVILDVVYNHAGPDGNYLPQFAPAYFSSGKGTDWGAAINYDAEGSAAVREFFLTNAACWISEFHLDGLRLDATQDIHDSSEKHILAEIVDRVHDAAAGRRTFIVAENEPQDVRLATPPERGGYGIDALFNEDFHHAAMVRLSGHAEAYYTDYRGSPQEFLSSAKYGFLFQGQWYAWQSQPRGTWWRGAPSTSIVNFIQNHDQIANTSRGLRCHAVSSAGCYRAMTALLLLSPGTPLLFQGQEFACSSPFFYFADHNDELAQLVFEGRRKFMRQFPSLSLPSVQARLPNPGDPASFERSKLDWSELETHADALALHRDLLELRRRDAVYSRPRTVDGAVLSDDALLIRDLTESGLDRLLIVNFGPDLHYSPVSEPLLAPPPGHQWELLWTSEDFIYGGSGTPPLEENSGWRIPGQTAAVLHPVADEN